MDGGPTPTGHRTPAVIVTLPVLGLDEASMRANYWVIHQVLAAGVHGILLCHTCGPESRSALFVEGDALSVRAEGHAGLDQGLRGSGSQGFAAQIWGISQNDYCARPTRGPLEERGSVLLGVKIEDSYALANAEKTTKVPGIAFAEWGQGAATGLLAAWPAAAGVRIRRMRRQCARRARASLKATKDAQDLLPEQLQRQERRRDDQGRRDDLYGRLRGRAGSLRNSLEVDEFDDSRIRTVHDPND